MAMHDDVSRSMAVICVYRMQAPKIAFAKERERDANREIEQTEAIVWKRGKTLIQPCNLLAQLAVCADVDYYWYTYMARGLPDR